MAPTLFNHFCNTESLSAGAQNGVGSSAADVVSGINAVKERVVACGFGMKDAQVTGLLQTAAE